MGMDAKKRPSWWRFWEPAPLLVRERPIVVVRSMSQDDDLESAKAQRRAIESELRDLERLASAFVSFKDDKP